MKDIQEVIKEARRQIRRNRRIHNDKQLEDPNTDIGIVLGTKEAELLLKQFET